MGTKHTPFAVLSRPVAGVRGGTFIVTLPGSPKVRLEAGGKEGRREGGREEEKDGGTSWREMHAHGEKR